MKTKAVVLPFVILKSMLSSNLITFSFFLAQKKNRQIVSFYLTAPANYAYILCCKSLTVNELRGCGPRAPVSH